MVKHPETLPAEVHCEITVGTPIGRFDPSAFGMYTLRTGGAV
jgi:hypothetical protein